MRSFIKIFVGIAILATAIIGYGNSLEYLYELTFLSNLIGGVVLLLDGMIYYVFKKNIPIIIYQMVVLCTNVVFFTGILTLLGWHSFNFKGAFIFLHAINPPLFLIIYMFFTELNIKDKSDYMKRIFVSPLLIMGYLVFDYIRYLITGQFVYGLVNAESFTAAFALLIGIVFYFLMAFMSYGIIDFKLYIQNRFQILFGSQRKRPY